MSWKISRVPVFVNSSPFYNINTIGINCELLSAHLLSTCSKILPKTMLTGRTDSRVWGRNFPQNTHKEWTVYNTSQQVSFGKAMRIGLHFHSWSIISHMFQYNRVCLLGKGARNNSSCRTYMMYTQFQMKGWYLKLTYFKIACLYQSVDWSLVCFRICLSVW